MPAEAQTRRTPLWMLPVVLLVTALVYWPALDGELVYDDLQMIARNPEITQLGNIPNHFTQSYWDFLGDESADYTGYWRPLTATMLTVAYVLGGASVAAFHALCILVHLAATAVAFFFARRVTGDAWIGFFAALLFGLHPVHVESVAWITALNDPLFGLFGLLSLDAFLRWRDRGSVGIPLAAALWLVPALLAKELAFAVVPMALAIDLGRRRTEGDGEGILGGFTAPLRAYAPFVAVGFAYYLARAAVFESPAAGLDRITTGFGVGAARLVELRVELLGGALQLLALPLDLNLFRPFKPTLPPGDLVLPIVCLLLTAGGIVWALVKQARPAALALLFMPAGVVPILLRVESLGRFPLSDRFLYLPVLGFTLLVALGLLKLRPRWLGFAALTAIAAVYSYLSFDRIGVWSNEVALFRSTVEADPRSPYAKWGLGRALLDRYGQTGDRVYLDEAFGVYESAQDLLEEVLDDPDTDVFASSTDFLQVNLGFAWCLILEAQIDDYRDFDTPIAVLEQVLERAYEVRDSPYVEPLELELVHTAIGVAHALAGRTASAEKAFRAALAENPNYPEAHSNYGKLLLDAGDPKRARVHLDRALEQRPESFKDRFLLARALFEDGWPEQAAEVARELHAESPEEPETMVLLATIEGLRKNPSGSLAWVDRVLAVAPDHPGAWERKAQALLALNENQEAIVAYRRAAQLNPRSFAVHYDFAVILLRSGAVDAGLPYLVTAYALCPDPNLYVQIRETLLQLPIDAEQATQLGNVERLRKRFDDAELWFDRAIGFDPENGEVLFHKARLLRDRGDLAGAADLMARSCELLPERFVPRFEYGLVLADLRRSDEAIASLERALEIGPPDTWEPQQAAGAIQNIERVIGALKAGEAVPLVGPPSPEGG